MFPYHVRGIVALGDSYLKQGKLQEAEYNYLRAESLQADSIEVLLPLGITALELGKLNDAREYLVRAESREDGNADVAYYMACLESLAGRKDEGLGWVERALRRGYLDKQKIMDDPRLYNLKADPRFSGLLGKFFDEKYSGAP
jgi:predicted Zn-dependent protease